MRVHIEPADDFVANLEVLDGGTYFYDSTCYLVTQNVMLTQFDNGAAVEAKLVVSSPYFGAGRSGHTTDANRCKSLPQTVVPVVSRTISFGSTTVGLFACSTLTCSFRIG